MDSGGCSPDARAQRLVIGQGDVVWASLGDPAGSGPGFRRPVVIVQGDPFNASRLATAIVVPITSSVRWAQAPGNVLLPAERTGLPKDSVANVSQLVAVGRGALAERSGRLGEADLRAIFAGIDVVLGRA